MPNHHDTLGVTRDADASTIKRAYQNCASKAHPDRGGSDETMALVNRAYEVLSDAERREQYDRTGSDAPARQPADEAAELLMQMFVSALEEPEGTFLVAVRNKLLSLTAQGASSLRQIEATLRRLKARRDSTKGPERNLAHMVMDQQINTLVSEQDRISKATETAKRALQLLGEYESTEVATPVVNWGTGMRVAFA